jgi:hypothetical protein
MYSSLYLLACNPMLHLNNLLYFPH